MNASKHIFGAALLFAIAAAAAPAIAAEPRGIVFDCAHTVWPSRQQTADLLGLSPTLPGDFAQVNAARAQLRADARRACQQHADASRVRLVLEPRRGERARRDARDRYTAATEREKR